MICQILFIAGAMKSSQALYYAETCYIKSLTYPIRTEACIQSLPGRKEEFEARAAAWIERYRPAFDAAKKYLDSVHYDFENGTASKMTQMARSWAKDDQNKGSAHMSETCDAHMTDLNS